MKKKTKFITAILSEDEWNIIKQVMVEHEIDLETLIAYHHGNKAFQNKLLPLYAIVHHFNSQSVLTIEELDEKDKKLRRKEKRNGKKNN